MCKFAVDLCVCLRVSLFSDEALARQALTSRYLLSIFFVDYLALGVGKMALAEVLVSMDGVLVSLE